MATTELNKLYAYSYTEADQAGATQNYKMKFHNTFNVNSENVVDELVETSANIYIHSETTTGEGEETVTTTQETYVGYGSYNVANHRSHVTIARTDLVPDADKQALALKWYSTVPTITPPTTTTQSSDNPSGGDTGGEDQTA